MTFQAKKADGTEVTVWEKHEVDEAVEKEVKGLKVTNENLKSEKKDEAEKARLAKEAQRTAEEDLAKAQGDNETLKRLAEEREAEKRQAVDDERKKTADLLTMVKKEKVDNYLNDLVESLKPADATKAKHLKRLLRSEYEFDVDVEKGEFSVKGGNVTSVEQLKKHVTESEEFQYLLAGSGASGGGSGGGSASGGGKKFEECTGAELVKIKNDNPAEYDRMKKDYDQRQ